MTDVLKSIHYAADEGILEAQFQDDNTFLISKKTFYTGPHTVAADTGSNDLKVRGSFPANTNLTVTLGTDQRAINVGTERVTALDVAALVAGAMLDMGQAAQEEADSDVLHATVKLPTATGVSVTVSNDTEVSLPADIKAVMAKLGA